MNIEFLKDIPENYRQEGSHNWKPTKTYQGKTYQYAGNFEKSLSRSDKAWLAISLLIKVIFSSFTVSDTYRDFQALRTGKQNVDLYNVDNGKKDFEEATRFLKQGVENSYLFYLKRAAKKGNLDAWCALLENSFLEEQHYKWGKEEDGVYHNHLGLLFLMYASAISGKPFNDGIQQSNYQLGEPIKELLGPSFEKLSKTEKNAVALRFEKESFKNFKFSADEGNIGGLHNLEDAYRRGTGTEKNIHEAEKLKPQLAKVEEAGRQEFQHARKKFNF